MVKFQAAGNEILRLGTHPVLPSSFHRSVLLFCAPTDRHTVRKHNLLVVAARILVKEERESITAQTSAQGSWTWPPPAWTMSPGLLSLDPLVP